jgi:hypothetical protein
MYENDHGTFPLHRNEGMRILAFDIEQLRLAFATSVNKRPRDRTGCTFHVQRNDGREMELVAYPVTGTDSYVSETTEQQLSFESRMVSPQHERLYFCLVDITPGSTNPGHIWRLL